MTGKISGKSFCVLGLFFCLAACHRPVSSEWVETAPQGPSIDYRRAALLNVELGLTYLSENEPVLAKQKLLKAFQLNPNLPEAHAAMGGYFSFVKMPKAAASEYEKALRLAPRDPKILDQYAQFLCQQEGQAALADRYFRRALCVLEYSDRALISQNAGLCALKAKEWKLADTYFQEALAQDPHLTLVRRAK